MGAQCGVGRARFEDNNDADVFFGGGGVGGERGGGVPLLLGRLEMGAQCGWGWGRVKEIYGGSKTRVQANERTGSRSRITRLTTTQCTYAGEIQGTLVLAFFFEFCFVDQLDWVLLLFFRVIGCSSHRLFPNLWDKVCVLCFVCIRREQDM